MYHPRKVNVVEDVLSMKTVHMSNLLVKEMDLVEKFRNMDLYVERSKDDISYGMITDQGAIRVEQGQNFSLGEYDILRLVYILNDKDVPRLEEDIFGGLEEVAKYVVTCPTYQKAKIMDIPKWKWGNITMAFVVSLPRTIKGFDVIRNPLRLSMTKLSTERAWSNINNHVKLSKNNIISMGNQS
ncbi:hypothetical protein CR513_31999, partial [Mucuna pruriens]